MIWMLITFWVTIQPQVPKIEFNIEPQSLKVGESTTLSWKVTDGDKVFISYIGKVGINGQMLIKPDETTDYTLVAEGSHGVTVRTMEVIVSGSRGSEFTELGFTHPYSSKVKALSLPDLLDHIHNVLQDSLQFNLREYHDNRGLFVFLTQFSQKDSLVRRQEIRIGARRIAYLVEVSEQKSRAEFAYTIKTLIEYRRRIERTWRREDNDSMYYQQARKLRDLINNIR